MTAALDLAPTGPAYVYRATCRHVVDGDTIEADVDTGFGITARLRIRLRGYDSPEVPHPLARAGTGTPGYRAAAYLHDLVAPDDLMPVSSPAPIRLDARAPLLLRTYKDTRTFERWVADVWVTIDGRLDLIADLMIAAGHAVPMTR